MWCACGSESVSSGHLPFPRRSNETPAGLGPPVLRLEFPEAHTWAWRAPRLGVLSLRSFLEHKPSWTPHPVFLNNQVLLPDVPTWQEPNQGHLGEPGDMGVGSGRLCLYLRKHEQGYSKEQTDQGTDEEPVLSP